MKPSDKAIDAAALAIQQHGPEPHVARLIAQVALHAAFAAQFHPSEDYAGLVDRLNMLDGNETQWSAVWEIAEEAADALEALLAVNAELSVAFKERDQAIAERDALKNELIDYKDAAASEADFANEQTEKYRKLQSERDALLARLAPLPVGDGITDDLAAIQQYRALIKAVPKTAYVLEDLLAKRKAARLAPVESSTDPLTNGMTVAMPDGDEKRLVVVPVEDEALVEIGIGEIERGNEKQWHFAPIEAKNDLRNRMRNAIAAIRPHIEAAEREKLRENIKPRFPPKSAQQIRDETDRLIEKHRESVNDWLEAGSWKQSGGAND